VTTIATDGYTMAGDGRVCAGGILETNKRVKVFRIGKEIIGCSGTSNTIDAYLKWLRKEGPEPLLDDGALVIAIHLCGKNKVYRVESPNYSRIRVQTPYAIGSGRELAIGAMLAGKTPSQAVRIATKLDTASGGKITEISLLQQ